MRKSFVRANDNTNHHMKKIIAFTAIFATAGASAWAAAFTAGDLVIYRVGTGSGALSSSSTAVFLDEYTTTGTLVQSIAVDTSGSNQLTASGSATSEGMLTRSADGKYIAISGYDAATGVASIKGTASSVTQRAALVYGTSGTVVSKTTFGTTAFSGDNVRSAYTSDGTNVWMSGTGSNTTTNGGVWYSNGATTTQIAGGNIRDINVSGGQMYASTGAGSSSRIEQLGSGVPTSTASFSNLNGLPTSGNAEQFAFFDLNGSVAGIDTLYYATETTLAKYTFNGTTWAAAGTVSGSIFGLTAVLNGSNVDLYATTATTLVKFTDTTGALGSISGSFTTLATAGTNTNFRGVTFTAVPEPTTTAIGIVGLLGAILVFRRKFESQ